VGTEEKPDERRRDRRFDTSIYGVMFRNLTTPPSTEQDAYYAARSIDISKSGMRFETEHPLNKGDRIQYFVHSASGKSGREGTARVLRVEQAANWYNVAVEFVDTPSTTDSAGETE